MDRPESQQSIVIAGYLTDPYGQVDELAKNVMNDVLGGDFTSRINMNLREDKHWAYGARSLVWDAKGQRPYLAYAPVQTDKTKESIQEIQKEFDGFVGDSPVKQEEFDKVQKNSTLQLSGRWETNGGGGQFTERNGEVRFSRRLLPDLRRAHEKPRAGRCANPK